MSRKSGDTEKPRKASDTEKSGFDPDKEKLKISRSIEELGGKTHPKVAPYIKQAAPFLAQLAVLFFQALPYIIKAGTVIQEYASKLPEKIIYASLGFVVCFFGGVFPTTIAAFEAWRICGGREAIDSCREIYAEIVKFQDASAEDDKKDDDNDGVPDVQQITPQQLVTRKGKLALKAIDPENFNNAVMCLCTGWMGVLAILKVKFAKTVTLGNTIGGAAYKQAKKFEPAIEGQLPEEYRKWVSLSVSYTCKLLGMSLAWWVQRIISAFHSAIRGGLLFSHYLVEYLHEHGYLTHDAENSYIDEAIGWAIALTGFLFQFYAGFGLIFPFNLILWPVHIVEAFIVYSVSFV